MMLQGRSKYEEGSKGRSGCCLLLFCFFPGSFFDIEDGGQHFVWNICRFLTNYAASLSRRYNNSSKQQKLQNRYYFTSRPDMCAERCRNFSTFSTALNSLQRRTVCNFSSFARKPNAICLIVGHAGRTRTSTDLPSFGSFCCPVRADWRVPARFKCA
jgi:hypothetical protein